MAKPKSGLLFYSCDTDRFQDIRIKRLKKDMGCDGYAVYEYLLNEIYRVRGCFLVWDESTAFDVAEYWGLKESKVKEIVRYCCAVGLFDKALLSNGNVLTSSSIQSRYVNMCIRAKRKEIIIPEQYNILPEESKIILEEYRKVPERCRKVYKEKKENSLSGIKESPIIPEVLVGKSLGECKDELMHNRSWAETVVMNTRSSGHKDFTMEAFYDYLHKFFIKLENEGTLHKTTADAQSYFARWLALQLAKLHDEDYRQSNELLSQSEEPTYRSFLDKVKAEAPCCFQGMRMPVPDEFATLMKKADGDKNLIWGIVQTIENRKDIRQRRTSLYLTILEQLKRNNGN